MSEDLEWTETFTASPAPFWTDFIYGRTITVACARGFSAERDIVAFREVGNPSQMPDLSLDLADLCLPPVASECQVAFLRAQ